MTENLSLQSIPIHKYAYDISQSGRYAIPAVTLNNMSPDADASAAIHLVAGNGAWGGPQTLGPVATRFLQHAGANGIPASITMYEDPLIGSAACLEDNRTERLERVVQATAKQTGPVGVIGHSWSTKGALEVVSRGYGVHTASFIGYTVASGLQPRETFPDQFAGFVQELRAGDSLTVRGLGIMARVGAGAVALGLSASRTLLKEGRAALTANLTDPLVRVSHIMPSSLVMAEQDAFFGPVAETATNLRDAGFRGTIIVMPNTTHMGAVTDAANGRHLYAAVRSLEARAD